MKLKFKLALGLLVGLLLVGAGSAGALLASGSNKADSRTAVAARTQALPSTVAQRQPDRELSRNAAYLPADSLDGPGSWFDNGAAQMAPNAQREWDGDFDMGDAHMGGLGPKQLLKQLADALGTTVEDIMTQVRAGNTLAQEIANKGGNPDAIFDTLTKDLKTSLSKDVAAGNITQSQMDLRLGVLKEAYTRLINNSHLGRGAGRRFGGPGQFFGGPGRKFGGHFQRQPHGALAAGHGQIILGVAKSLNVSVTDVLADLKADKTVAQIIESHGKKVDDVVDFLTAGEKAKLSTEVSQGLITQKQADRRLAGLRERLMGLFQMHLPGARGSWGQ